MLLNLNKKMCGLDGKELEGEGFLICKIVSDLIAKSANAFPDTIRFWEIAETLYKLGESKITDEELKKIKEFISKTEHLVLGAKAQILKELEIKE